MDQITIAITNQILMTLGLCLASGWIGYVLGVRKNLWKVKLEESKSQLYKAVLDVEGEQVKEALKRIQCNTVGGVKR